MLSLQLLMLKMYYVNTSIKKAVSDWALFSHLALVCQTAHKMHEMLNVSPLYISFECIFMTLSLNEISTGSEERYLFMHTLLLFYKLICQSLPYHSILVNMSVDT